MKNKCFFIFLVMLTCMAFNVVYGAENEITRKIVSVVYDESMSGNKDQSYDYSNYALQMITALLGNDDKLKVIKDDDFECIDEAKEWLKDEAEYNEDTAKYWMFVITDGTFLDESKKLENFLDIANEEFKDLEYKFIFLNVDENVNTQLENVVKRVQNSSYLAGTNKQEIYDSMFQISKLLNLSDVNKVAITEKKGNKILEITSPFLLKKMTILIQDMKWEIKNISNENGLIRLNRVDVNSASQSLQGTIVNALSNDINYLKPGKTQIEFIEDFDIDDVIVLCETCVTPQITIVDEYDNVLCDDSWIYSTTNEMVKIKCELLNEFDDDKIRINTQNLNIELVSGQNKYPFKYDQTKNAYYAYVKMEKGSNYIYALAEVPDLLVAKSNNMKIEIVDTILSDNYKGTAFEQKFEMEVIHSYTKKYNFVDKFRFIDMGQAYPYDYHIIQVLDLPNGIIVEIDGKRYRKEQDIQVDFEYGMVHDIDFYCNSDYREKEVIEMILKMKNNFKESYVWNFDIGPIWKVDIVPKVNQLNKPDPIKLKLESTNNRINVNYSLDKEYKEIYEYKFSVEEGSLNNVSQVFELELLDIPNGIVIEYMEKQYRNKEKIPLEVEYGKIYNLKIGVNNEYRELKEKSIRLKLLTDVWGQDIYWESTNVAEDILVLVPEVHPINVIPKQSITDIQIPYSFDDTYKHFFSYNFVVKKGSEKNISGDFELQLLNVPNGIEFEYDGNRYKNNEKIPMYVDYNKIYVLDLYANSDYKEIKQHNIILKLLTNAFAQEISWNTTNNEEEILNILPKKYPIKIFNKYDEEIDTQNEVLELEITRVDDKDILNIIENIKLENIKNIEDNSSFFSGFTYKISKDEEKNFLILKFKPNIFTWIKGNKLKIELLVEFDNDIENAYFEQEIILTNLDMMVILKPCIIMLSGLFILCGYLFKYRFDSNAQILFTEDGDSIAYGLTPNILTILLPYVPHKAKIGMIKFKAGKNKTLIYSARNLKIAKIDKLSFKEYVKQYGFNDRKVIMKKGKSSVVIVTYDGEQKYEYLNGSSDVSNLEYKYIAESAEELLENLERDSDEYLEDGEYLNRTYMEDDQF